MENSTTQKPYKDAKKLILQRPKGTQDIVGEDTYRWSSVESLCREMFHQARFQEIRTPIFESTDLFERGVGEGTDIVSKEMYTFEKSERSLTLRPEGTAGVVRSFVEQGMSRWPKPVKLFYMGPMFRYERPQAGRQRQFHQIGVELFGPESAAADAEVILLAWRLFEKLQLPGLTLEVNNIGTPACRELFKAGLRERVEPYLTELCSDCQTRFNTNPLRMLDCKVPTCRAIYARPEIIEFLESDFGNEDSQKHFADLLDILTSLEIPYKRNFSLVRGLDYYTKTVFEITATHLGAQNAVCGGGRYDRLMSDLGGPATPAVGWALGQERLMALVGELPRPGLDFYIVTDVHTAAFPLAEKLRALGAIVEVDLSFQNFGKQLERAHRFNAANTLVLGSDEVSSDSVQVRNVSTKEQEYLSSEAFDQYAKRYMSQKKTAI